MTADIINLRRARKAKARHDKERDAAANRALHGVSNAERLAHRDADRRTQRHLDQSLRQGRTVGVSTITEANPEAGPAPPSPGCVRHDDAGG